MNERLMRTLLGFCSLFVGGIIGVVNIWTILVLKQSAPLPSLSAFFGILGLVVLHGDDR